MFLLNVVILQSAVYITLLHSFLGNGNEGRIRLNIGRVKSAFPSK